MPRATVSEHAAHASIRACAAHVSIRACSAQQYPVPEHAAARSSIRACHTQVSEHAARSAVSEHAAQPQPILALAQPLPAACQSPPSIRACRAQQYPGMPRTQVSEHAVRSSIRACRASKWLLCIRQEFWGPGLSLREASVGEEALPMDKAGGVLRRSLLWKPVAKRSGPQRLAVVFLERCAWATTTLFVSNR